MTNEQILKEAIEKAIKGGFGNQHFRDLNDDLDWFIEELACETIIFSHDFAKAFWGEEQCWICLDCERGGGVYYIEEREKHGWCRLSLETVNWKHHLQQMVLEKEPLKYLKRFL
jgi:hypothetical protein